MYTYADDLKNSFPSSLSDDIDAIIEIIKTSAIKIKFEGTAKPRRSVLLNGEMITFPLRQYFDEAFYQHSIEGKLTQKQKLIMDCFFTRHYNGFIREAYLKKILFHKESWIVPFVIELLGEYVSEILDVIYKNLDRLSVKNFTDFINENMSYYEYIKYRVISYWDCYYRWLYPNKRDYVGFKILHFLNKNLSFKDSHVPKFT